MTHMDFTRLTEFLDSLYEKEGIPATDCAVCHDHRVVYWHRTGFSDAARTKPVSENDMYILYSATKVMTMAGGLDYTWDTPAMEMLREKYGREISRLDAVNSYA